MSQLRSGCALVLAGVLTLGGSLSLANEVDRLDPTFGSSGVAYGDFGVGASGRAFAVAVGGDGKIVVAGAAGANGGGVARFLDDGTPDAGFGDGGSTTVPFLSGLFDAVAVQGDGKIVAAGYVASADTHDVVVARLEADGDLDHTFGVGGVVQTDLAGGSSDGAHAVAIQADGKIVVGGKSGLDPFEFAVVRYEANGVLDATFGNGGSTITGFADGGAIAYALVVQPDGKIVLGGKLEIDEDRRQSALARYDANGQLDASFGEGGRVTTEIFRLRSKGVSWAEIHTLAVQPDGKILAGGWAAREPFHVHFAVGRYEMSGAPDRRFGRRGSTTTSFLPRDQLQVSIAYVVAMQPDGKVVAGGDGYPEPALARYRSTGRRDASFADRGISTSEVPVRVNGGAMQPDGKMILAGDALEDGPPGFAVLRIVP